MSSGFDEILQKKAVYALHLCTETVVGLSAIAFKRPTALIVGKDQQVVDFIGSLCFAAFLGNAAKSLIYKGSQPPIVTYQQSYPQKTGAT